eukprot:tig00020912_g15860.t1
MLLRGAIRPLAAAGARAARLQAHGLAAPAAAIVRHHAPAERHGGLVSRYISAVATAIRATRAALAANEGESLAELRERTGGGVTVLDSELWQKENLSEEELRELAKRALVEEMLAAEEVQEEEVVAAEKERTVEVIVRERQVDEFNRAYGTGRRKTSVARVWIKPGTGIFLVNGMLHTEYFSRLFLRHRMVSPLLSVDAIDKFDVWCTAKGGGSAGQADAIRLGVARALQNFDPSLRPLMKPEGHLTRDDRMVESKKVAHKKARRGKQWSKR